MAASRRRLANRSKQALSVLPVLPTSGAVAVLQCRGEKERDQNLKGHCRAFHAL